MSTIVYDDRSGWWWPADDVHAKGVILRDCEPSIRQLLPHVRGRDCIIQAGANVGVYPIALTDHFQRVITAEPHPVNWECLEQNLTARDPLGRIEAFPAAFGANHGACKPTIVELNNCGAHRVAFEGGPVEVIRIDDLSLEHIDAIWVDVEGSELFALQGAENTIERFKPVICAEDKGLHRAFNIPDGALQAWLDARGYHEVDLIGRDKVFARR